MNSEFLPRNGKKAKRNVLVWPRAAGVGDMIVVLAFGMIHFGARPFHVVIHRVSPWLAILKKHYSEYYRQLCASFSLCKSLEILNLSTAKRAREAVKDHISPSDHIVFVNDFGHKNLKENAPEVREKFSRYFYPKARAVVKKAVASDRINICFHLRSFKTGEAFRNYFRDGFLDRCVNMEKWIKFLKYAALIPGVRLIGIGDSNPRSPYHISREDMKSLLELPNVVCPYLEMNTTMNEDAYLIAHSDLFIGSHSGPWVLASFLGKSLLVFDYGIKRSDMKRTIFNVADNQKIFMGYQSFEEMIELFECFWRSGFVSREPGAVAGVIESRRGLLMEEISRARALFSDFSIDRDSGSSDEAYYSLAKYYLKHKYFEKAQELLNMSFEYTDLADPLQFYTLGKAFKDAGKPDAGMKYLKKAYIWMLNDASDKRSLCAILCLLADIYIEKNNVQSAVVCLQRCLRHIPDYALGLVRLGVLYGRMNMPERKEELIRRAREAIGRHAHSPRQGTESIPAGSI